MSRTLSVYDLAALAHREMSRVSPESAIGESDDDDELDGILNEDMNGTAQLFFARLDEVEARQKKHEKFLKLILKKVSGSD